MRVPWRNAPMDTGSPTPPVRLSQRWAMILGLGNSFALDLSQSLGTNAAASASAGMLLIGLLHQILE